MPPSRSAYPDSLSKKILIIFFDDKQNMVRFNGNTYFRGEIENEFTTNVLFFVS
jgi:hypothetical protein